MEYINKSIFEASSPLIIPAVYSQRTCDKTILKAGQSTVIPFDMWHKFKAITDVECIETYEVKFGGEDIERRTQGGLIR